MLSGTPLGSTAQVGCGSLGACVCMDSDLTADSQFVLHALQAADDGVALSRSDIAAAFHAEPGLVARGADPMEVRVTHNGLAWPLRWVSTSGAQPHDRTSNKHTRHAGRRAGDKHWRAAGVLSRQPGLGRLGRRGGGSACSCCWPLVSWAAEDYMSMAR